MPGYHGDDVPVVRCAGAKAERARAAARLLVQKGCDGLLSFGVAGGLSPDLKPGSVVVADAVIGPDGTVYETDADWGEGLLQGIAGKVDIKVAAITGRDKAITNAQEKKELFEKTGAVAVDMESHAVAEIAAHAGIPFLAIRAIADPSKRQVPGWVMKGIADDGSIKTGVMVGGLLQQPWALPKLMLLGLESRKAEKALRRVAFSAGGRFGLA